MCVPVYSLSFKLCHLFSQFVGDFEKNSLMFPKHSVTSASILKSYHKNSGFLNSCNF